MKQYRRTRTEASREGVQAAKKTIKANSIRSIHPLIAGCDPVRCRKEVIEKATFVRMLQTFRPAQTVFESGIGLGTGSQIIKGKGKGKKSSSEAHGVEIMQALRRVAAPALERNKQKLVRDFNSSNSGSHMGPEAPEEDGGGDAGRDESQWEDTDTGDEDEPDQHLSSDEFLDDGASVTSTGSLVLLEKPRLSIAQRKKMKRQGLSSNAVGELVARRAATDRFVSSNVLDGGSSSSSSSSSSAAAAAMSCPAGAFPSAAAFKDNRYYMSYGNEDERASFSEHYMQPMSGLRTAEAQSKALLCPCLCFCLFYVYVYFFCFVFVIKSDHSPSFSFFFSFFFFFFLFSSSSSIFKFLFLRRRDDARECHSRRTAGRRDRNKPQEAATSLGCKETKVCKGMYVFFREENFTVGSNRL